jgi:hypothetical protein
MDAMKAVNAADETVVFILQDPLPLAVRHEAYQRYCENQLKYRMGQKAKMAGRSCARRRRSAAAVSSRK